MSFRTPKYRLHKGSGQALVQIKGERVYLGKYDSPESKEEYRRLVAEFLASTQCFKSNGSSDPAPPSPILVNDLILAYWQFAKAHYVKDGKPTTTLAGIRSALRPLRRLYGGTPAGGFGPKKLKTIRHHLIEGGNSRGVVNKRIGDSLWLD